MRTLTNSAMTIRYPENITFSGDLNLIEVTKNTTATFFEISFVISGYTYKENLYFFGTKISFSMQEILKLLFDRTENTTFLTTKNLNFTIKLYNNTSLIDTENLSIAKVILGKRKVFDKFGVVKSTNYYEYSPDIGITSFYFDWNEPAQQLWYMDVNNVEHFVTNLNPLTNFYNINIATLSPAPLYFFYGTFDPTFDDTFQNRIDFVSLNDCGDETRNIGIRFLNRFGLWRYYGFKLATETNSAGGGISVDFVAGNYSEYSGLKATQQKRTAQGITISKNNISKIVLDDFSDIVGCDHVHIYDDINSIWIPIGVSTTSTTQIEKEDLYDLVLNLNLKVNE